MGGKGWSLWSIAKSVGGEVWRGDSYLFHDCSIDIKRWVLIVCR